MLIYIYESPIYLYDEDMINEYEKNKNAIVDFNNKFIKYNEDDFND
jgi:hypothetical protein